MHLIFSRFVFEFVYFSNCNSTDYCRKLTQILALHPVKNISLYYYYFFTNILHFFHVIKWVPGFHTCSFSCLLMSCIFFLILSNYFFFQPDLFVWILSVHYFSLQQIVLLTFVASRNEGDEKLKKKHLHTLLTYTNYMNFIKFLSTQVLSCRYLLQSKCFN